MNVISSLLGQLDSQHDVVMHFPHGVFGFPGCRAWVIADAGRSGLYWLQSADEQSLTFLIADPFVFFPDYVVDLGHGALEELEATSPTDVAVFAIITLPGPVDPMPTVNLQGPLVLNLRARRGMQLVLQDSAYGVRQEIHLGP
ncbi:MAG: flagellar assembly protein FliW [Gemmatimonadaceae bacterium]|nr:flagellar assembly protein FliW [Gemmatimonadaceae bacterium]